MLKKIGKTIGWIILGLITFFGLYFLFMVLLTIIPSNSNFKEAENGKELYIISNGVHTDLCFAVEKANLDWPKILNINLFETPADQVKYISIGWGDKGFYFDTPSWAELSAKTAITAAFFPSPTAMHVTLLKEEPVLGERIRKVKISNQQLQDIEEYIRGTFQLKTGNAVHIDCCRYEGYDDNFYEAKGSYHMLRTCNVWANETLKEGGIKTASWAPFDKCILYHF